MSKTFAALLVDCAGGFQARSLHLVRQGVCNDDTLRYLAKMTHRRVLLVDSQGCLLEEIGGEEDKAEVMIRFCDHHYEHLRSHSTVGGIPRPPPALATAQEQWPVYGRGSNPSSPGEIDCSTPWSHATIVLSLPNPPIEPH